MLARERIEYLLDEEGLRFGTGFFGSAAIIGQPRIEDLERLDEEGVSLEVNFDDLQLDATSLASPDRDLDGDVDGADFLRQFLDPRGLRRCRIGCLIRGRDFLLGFRRSGLFIHHRGRARRFRRRSEHQLPGALR